MVSVMDDSVSRVGTDNISAYHWLLFGICFLANIMGGTASTLMSVYLPVLVRDLLGTVGEEELSQVSAYISALYFVGWAIGGLSMGVIGDRIGRAWSLVLSIGMFGMFTFLISFASSWEMILVFRFFCGFGVGGMMVITQHFFRKRGRKRPVQSSLVSYPLDSPLVFFLLVP
jgi:MFS family permease